MSPPRSTYLIVAGTGSVSDPGKIRPRVPGRSCFSSGAGGMGLLMPALTRVSGCSGWEAADARFRESLWDDRWLRIVRTSKTTVMSTIRSDSQLVPKTPERDMATRIGKDALPPGTLLAPAASFFVTASSNEAQHILIGNSLTPPVLISISPGGQCLPTVVSLLLLVLGERQIDIHRPDQAP